MDFEESFMNAQEFDCLLVVVSRSRGFPGPPCPRIFRRVKPSAPFRFRNRRTRRTTAPPPASRRRRPPPVRHRRPRRVPPNGDGNPGKNPATRWTSEPNWVIAPIYVTPVCYFCTKTRSGRHPPIGRCCRVCCRRLGRSGSAGFL